MLTGFGLPKNSGMPKTVPYAYLVDNRCIYVYECACTQTYIQILLHTHTQIRTLTRIMWAAVIKSTNNKNNSLRITALLTAGVYTY